MIQTTEQFDGDEWQDFVVQLLYLRYGTDLIEVPDQHKGDSGIEAFTTDGCAFQCYSPEAPSNVAEVAAKHKAKISRDVKKLLGLGIDHTLLAGKLEGDLQQWRISNHV